MLGFGATGQFSIGEVAVTGTGAEIISVDKWFQKLSEPIRAMPRSPAAMSPFIAMDPQPFVSFSWFEGLAEPIRNLPRSPAAMSPFHFMQPTPVVSFGWFGALTEPIRSRPSLKTGENPFFFFQPAPSPFVATGWFTALSEPVHFKVGLRPPLQQFFAAPHQLRPNPAIFGTLSALETKDVFLGGLLAWNKVISGEIGVIESRSTGTEIGITVPVIAGSRVSIRIIE